MSGKKDIYSHHIFMLPFRVIDAPVSENSGFENIVGAIKKGNLWSDAEFGLSAYQEYNYPEKEFSKDEKENFLTKNNESIWLYNQFSYFYDYSRKFLFTNNNQDSDMCVKHYTRNLIEESYMNLHIIDDKNTKKEFHLAVDSIRLIVFNNEVGVLSIFLSNKCHHNFDDVLLINDYGRRIYPQFLGTQKEPEDDPITKPRENFFCEAVTITGIYEDSAPLKASDFICKTNEKKEIPFAPYIQAILGDWILCPGSVQNKVRYELESIFDDRMYVVCWCGDDNFSREVRQFNSWFEEKKHKYNEVMKKWYQFVFVDGRWPGIADKKMVENLIKNTSYTRWVESNEYATLFGISRYSLVCLTSGKDDFQYNIIRNHTLKMYYNMALFLLTQRSTIVSFLSEISEVSKSIVEYNKISKNTYDKYQKLENILERTTDINARIIQFNNTLWFTEVTPQEQGIEMFAIAQKNMNLQPLAESMNNKIKELYGFIDLQNERETSTIINTLTIIGALFVPLSLAASLFGMDIYCVKMFYADNFWPRENFTIFLFFQTFMMFVYTTCFLINYLFSLVKTARIINFYPGISDQWQFLWESLKDNSVKIFLIAMVLVSIQLLLLSRPEWICLQNVKYSEIWYIFIAISNFPILLWLIHIFKSLSHYLGSKLKTGKNNV